MVTAISEYERIDVFIGMDVGQGEHRAIALDRTGNTLYDMALANDERKLRAVLDKHAKHGHALLVVDQPATIGALPVADAGGTPSRELPVIGEEPPTRRMTATTWEV